MSTKKSHHKEDLRGDPLKAGHAAGRMEAAANLPGLGAEAMNLRTLAFWSAINGFASMCRKGVLRYAPGATIPDGLAAALAERAIFAALAPRRKFPAWTSSIVNCSPCFRAMPRAPMPLWPGLAPHRPA